MIAHVVEFHGPADKLEKTGMDGFHERVVPVLRAQPGFAGTLILLDRQHDTMLGITLWDSDENGKRAGERLAQEIRQGENEMGATAPAPLLYEVMAQL
jgi:hypothetical protein